MKKLLAAIFVALLMVGLCLQAMGVGTGRWQNRADTPEGSLPRLTKPLLLDAKLDEWEGATSLSVRNASYISKVKPGREWRGPLDAGAEMYCAWNDDGLCLAAIVADDTIQNERPPGLTWQQDCLELFIDGRTGEKFMKPPYSKGAYQLFVRPPTDKLPAALFVSERDGTIAGLRIFGQRTPTGYVVEMFIPWSAFPEFRPKTGSQFGLQYSLCDYDERDQGTNQPMVMSWRAATMLFQSPQKLIRYELVKAIPLGTDASLASIVNIAIPPYIGSGDSATFSVEMAVPLAPLAQTVEILVSDWDGKVVLQRTERLQKMAKPWSRSKQGICEWMFADVENGVYQIEARPKDAHDRVLGSTMRSVFLYIPGKSVARNAFAGTLPKLAKPFVIDAKLDEWQGATSLSVRYASYIATIKPGHEWHGPKDAGAEMYCAWNDDGLCLAAIVADDAIQNERPPGLTWQQDCLELFIDGRTGEKFMKPPYSKGAYQLFVRPPTDKLPAALHVSGRDGTIDGLRIAGRRTEAGYTVEMFIPWSAFPEFRPETGSRFGLQYSLCDYDKRDNDTNQPMVMSWRAATMLFMSPQKMVRYELAEAVPLGTEASLASLVNMDIPKQIGSGDSTTFSIEMGRPLAQLAQTVEILVSDWDGKVVLQRTKRLQKMAKPWSGSKSAVCEWAFGNIENGAYKIKVQPKDVRGKVLGSAACAVVIARKPFLRWRPGIKPTILAHRGAPLPDLPENSIAAFEQALTDGADFIEIDVRQSKDGVFIIHHDGGLGRTTNGGHDDKVSEQTLAELKTLFLKTQAGKVSTHKILTLKETIDWARGKTVLFVDFKILEIEKVIEFIQAEKAQTFCVPMTYRFEDTLRVHSLAPEMVIYANADGTRNNVEKLLKGDIPKDRLFVWVRSTNKSVIDRMHANGIMVQYGGVQGGGGKSLEPYLGFLKKGIDSFNTDDVPRAAAAIRKFYKR